MIRAGVPRRLSLMIVAIMTTLDLHESGARLLEGPAGKMEVIFDLPDGEAEGIAVVAHPQPLLGGSARHKIPHFLARALREAGWVAARPNFRGVGNSEGAHDEGRGETDDMLALCAMLRAAYPGKRLALVGFSFGAFVLAKAARTLADRGEPAWRTCLAGMPYGKIHGRGPYEPPMQIPDALVVHGERDERVPLSAIFDWARPQGQPVVVIPDADHFFSGKLPVLRSAVLGHLAA